MLEINEKNFDELVVQSVGTVLVKVSAALRAPCLRLNPIVETISNEMVNIKFYEIDADESPGMLKRFGVRSVPTILIFKNGTLDKSIVGLTSKEKIKEALI